MGPGLNPREKVGKIAWTDNSARGLLWIGENKFWRDALNLNLNASGKNGAPTLGFANILLFLTLST